MNKENKVFKLQGKVQSYAWGGSSYLPGLLSVPNTDHRPFAEYWMGAHDNAPSLLLMGNGGAQGDAETSGNGGTPVEESIPLNRYIAERPADRLGSYSSDRFGRLP